MISCLYLNHFLEVVEMPLNIITVVYILIDVLSSHRESG